MKKRLLFLLSCFYVFVIFAQSPINIIPAVQKWENQNQMISFGSIQVKTPRHTSEKEQELFNLFQKELRQVRPSDQALPQSRVLYIDFKTAPTSANLQPDGYTIALGKKVKVQATTYNGFLYATRTLLQLFAQKQYQNKIPKGIIEDFPNYKKRMLMIDVARKFFTLEEIKDFIRVMAWLKMNELHLHLSDNSWGGYSAYRLESEHYPQLTAKDGHYTWKEIRHLQDFAHTYGITITPEIDSPGHSLAFTNIRPDLKTKWLSPNYLDITNPDTYTFMKRILEEVIPHFDAPDFHLGTDEYRIHAIKDDSLKGVLGETFRGYINHFNKVVKGLGKHTRIWSGYEHMPGKTPVDKDVIIDMWETSDAKAKSQAGYQFINSTHYYTYIVPGAPYYGVNNKFIYEKWTPEIFSNKDAQNLNQGDKGLLGSKMHIWTDYGPTGFSISEIARLSVPSMFFFSEKMWGTKSDRSFHDQAIAIEKHMRIPLTHILDRNFTKETVILEKQHVLLHKEKRQQTGASIKNVEYPWTLEMTLKTPETLQDNTTLLSSSLATIYANLNHTFKKKKETINKTGFAIVRANQTAGNTPLTSHKPQVIVFDYQIPSHKTVTIKLVGERRKTTLYVDGERVGSEPIQMICPVEYLGSAEENNFTGTLDTLRVIQNQVRH